MPCGHPPPSIPLPAGQSWPWRCGGPVYQRIFHRDNFTPTEDHRRNWGPSLRFDPHRGGPTGRDYDPDRSVIYVGQDLRTCAIEVFQIDRAPYLPPEIHVCERFEVAFLVPDDEIRFQDLIGPAATDIGALQVLGSGDVHRSCSQEWARAIYDQRPAGDICGVRYTASRGGGDSLAIWNGSPTLTVHGTWQLHEPQVWHQLQRCLQPLGVTVTKIRQVNCVRCLDSGEIESDDFVPLP